MEDKYYEILKIKKSATIEEIEASYEKLSEEIVLSKLTKADKNIHLESLRQAYSSLIDLKMEEERENTGIPFQWYVARSYIANEDRLIESLWDKLRQHNLSDCVKEIISFKETVIVESEEMTHDSSELPKLAFKNSPSSVWVKLKNGNFKRIKLTVKRPYKCFIFFNMLSDFDLFTKINSWLLGLTFLDFPNLKVISEEDIKKMKSNVKEEIPNLMEYIAEKEYEVISGPVADHTNESSYIYTKDDEYDDEEGIHLMDKKEVFVNEVQEEKEIFSASFEGSRENIVIEKLRINDFVFVSEMGTKGVVIAIDLKERIVTVNINLFGRNQTIQCKPEQLKEF
ncbi:transcription termination/antitermination protein NusG [Mycoplasma parvum]|uniref:Transcription termination/antitermination protein NusG n=1 Tax=Mycoplasma parvum str. Indiana TaxID=1403316 RepID=U5NB49_9MOLU|nr:transcription termination/antitermination protein NusG [Mycoplasma parvum]AGX88801.1 hypothetical protein PRV_00050 [Mycoplasma parvum str. Indiana]